VISFSEFSKIDIRVGKVLSIENHPNADKLYILKVEIGDKKIQLVAGLKQHYQPQQLEGKYIVVVTNLEPRILRGVESQGMLLAATSEDGVISVLTLDRELPSGSKVR